MYRVLFAVAVACFLFASTDGFAAPDDEGSVTVTTSSGSSTEAGLAALKHGDLQHAYAILRPLAEKGDLKAQRILGTMYMHGKGVPQNTDEGLQWFKRAAEQGDAEAMTYLAIFYASGGDKPIDGAEALKWFHKAADAGGPIALGELGRIYRYGLLSVAKDETQAVKFWTAGAEKGDVASMVGLGVHYSVTSDLASAQKWLELAASKNNSQAMFLLGSLYSGAYPLVKDQTLAFKWFQKAANGGNRLAALNVARMYLNGEGVAKDQKRARNILSNLVGQGFLQATALLGQIYEKGIGTDKDMKMALKIYNLGSDNDVPEAKMRLARLYIEGRGIGKDEATGLRLYKEAAALGSSAAKFQLGVAYKNGIGTDKNEAEGEKWLKAAKEEGFKPEPQQVIRKTEGRPIMVDQPRSVEQLQLAADEGDPVAMRDLALRYATGNGVTADMKQAYDLFKAAADKGNIAAMNDLGALLLKRRNRTPEDEQRAISWLRKAADDGQPNAMLTLAMIYFNGKITAKNPAEAYKWARLTLRFFPVQRPGHKAAEALAQKIAGELSPEQTQQIEAMSANWQPAVNLSFSPF